MRGDVIRMGETEEGAGFRGKSKGSLCYLDVHFEMVGREYNRHDWELTEMEKRSYLI